MFNLRKSLSEGDYVLMTSKLSSHYLQIGEIIEVEYYPNSNDVELYRIEFDDTIAEYGYKIRDDLKVLMFEKYYRRKNPKFNKHN